MLKFKFDKFLGIGLLYIILMNSLNIKLSLLEVLLVMLGLFLITFGYEDIDD